MQSLSPKDWINVVDELTIERSKNNLIYSKKKRMISLDIKIHLTINLTVSRKIYYLRWIIKVINNKKKKNSSRVDG